MARALKPSVAAPSKDQAENLFAESEHAIEMLKSSLEDLAASQSFAEEAAKRPVPQLVDRFLLSGALNTHLADAKAHLSKGRTVFNATDVPKVIQAGRQAYADADRHRKIVGLLGALTSASRTLDADIDGHYHNFQALLANDYRDFASRENYPQEADAYSDLQKIFARLGELRIAPRLANMNICAVAGGFSSGKSSFLNALIGKKILPTHIDPTTSIPTYIFHVDGTSRVDAFNHYGGDVEIDAGVFKEMTHDFKRNHKIELKRLVHRVSIYTQALSSWANLALIDTPGYSNPEDGRVSTNGGTGQRDEDIALANVLKSQFLIWVVDCENGTLPEQDIHFIRKFVEERLGETQDNLYLVLNKAEKRAKMTGGTFFRLRRRRPNQTRFHSPALESTVHIETSGTHIVDCRLTHSCEPSIRPSRRRQPASRVPWRRSSNATSIITNKKRGSSPQQLGCSIAFRS